MKASCYGIMIRHKCIQSNIINLKIKSGSIQK
jgi:hypothetical protein